MDKQNLNMEAVQQFSVFAQIIDKLRDKSEEELKEIYIKLSSDNYIEKIAMVSDVLMNYEKKKTKKPASLNEVFGVWKDKNIRLESIREEAWQREK